MTDIRKVIKRIRNIPRTPVEITDPVDIRLAEARGEMRMDEEYQKQVNIIRDRNFKKAQEARARMLEDARAEQERQDDIVYDRLKNLKKARKVLERMRNEA
jgi:hypothetical protein